MPPGTESSDVDVSVIVIGHNVVEEILEALDSIEQHSDSLKLQTIVVDNGSTDGTHAAVAERFPDVTLIRLPVNEVHAARNHGLAIARGRFVMFLDSDARLTDGAMSELVRFLEERPEFGLVGPRLVYEDGDLQYSARRYPPLLLPLLRRPPLERFFEDGPVVRRHLMMDEALDEPREVEYLIGACLVFASDAALGARIDPHTLFTEDVDWCFQVRTTGYRIAYDPNATVVHTYRRPTAQTPLSRAALQHLLGFLRLHWKWRKQRRRLIEEGREIDRRGGRLDPEPESRLDPALRS
jgi:N-acetylglucosaminyl-diphospho-decaprenol L-rhamnosyltransferase